MTSLTDVQVTPKQLAEWQALCDAATPEPWESHGAAMNVYGLRRLMFRFMNGDQHTGMQISVPNGRMSPEHCDAAFIVASRTAMPALIAYARALETKRDRLHDEVERLKTENTRLQNLTPWINHSREHK